MGLALCLIYFDVCQVFFSLSRFFRVNFACLFVSFKFKMIDVGGLMGFFFLGYVPNQILNFSIICPLDTLSKKLLNPRYFSWPTNSIALVANYVRLKFLTFRFLVQFVGHPVLVKYLREIFHF